MSAQRSAGIPSSAQRSAGAATLPPTDASDARTQPRASVPTRPWSARPLAWQELSVCIVVFVMYLPALVLTYGLKDDYTYLASAHGYRYAGAPEPESSIRLGRPLFGLLIRGLYAALPNVSYLWIARALSLLAIAWFAVVLLRALAGLVGRPWLAVPIVLFICAMPPFQVYAGWATLFPASFAAALSATAALVVASATAREPGRAQSGQLVLGGVLLLLALATYQPTAMAFWLIALIVALTRRHAPRTLSAYLRAVAAVGVPAMICAFLILKVGVWTLGAANAQRSGLVTDLGAKLRWIPQPLGLALSLFQMPQSAAFAAVAAILCVAGAVLFCRDCPGRQRAGLLFLAALAVPLSFAPNLLSEENYATFRTVGPLTGVFALLLMLLFLAVDRDADRSWQRVASRACLIALSCLAVVLGFNHMRTLIALPQSREWRLVRAQANRLPANPVRVGFAAPTLAEGPIKVKYGVRDEFGVPTSASTWADPSVAWLAAKQAGRVTTANLSVQVVVGEPSQLTPGQPYFDMRKLEHLR